VHGAQDFGMPGYFKITSLPKKTGKNTTERLELKKFNPIIEKMTVHKEIK